MLQRLWLNPLYHFTNIWGWSLSNESLWFDKFFGKSMITPQTWIGKTRPCWLFHFLRPWLSEKEGWQPAAPSIWPLFESNLGFLLSCLCAFHSTLSVIRKSTEPSWLLHSLSSLRSGFLSNAHVPGRRIEKNSLFRPQAFFYKKIYARYDD